MLKRSLLAGLAALVAIGSLYVGISAAEVAPESVALTASLSPEKMRTEKPTAISLHLGFTVPLEEGKTPALSAIRFGVSRRIAFHYAGLTPCSLKTLLSSYGEETCARSLVGRGFVVSEVTLQGQPPTTIYGVAKAYYSFDEEQPRILVRVVSGEPLPLIYVIPFTIAPGAKPYTTSIAVRRMRQIQGLCARNSPNCFEQPYSLKGIYSQISELQLTLHRRFRHHGHRDSFVSAECIAAPTQREVSFPLATVDLLYEQASLTASQTARCEQQS